MNHKSIENIGASFSKSSQINILFQFEKHHFTEVK